MKKLVTLIIISLGIFGCQPRDTIEVPVIPPFKAAIVNNQPWIVDKSEVFNKVKLLAAEVNPVKVPHIYVEDARYVVVDHEWMLEMIEWWDEFKWTFGIKYVAEGFDCDNFADFLASVVDLSNRNIDAEIILGVLNVEQKNAFGSVPSGNRHALNFFASNQGIFVLEPQGAKSKVVGYHDYPNAKYVYEIKLN